MAAFAQSNAGDVTPNLNLNNTGPGKTDTESTRIIGARQARAAEKLLVQAAEPLRGPIAVCHAFVDFSRLVVEDAVTRAGRQRTCPSAFGYSFAAGSAEDGGGHPLFHEGMKESRPVMDTIVRTTMPALSPTPELRECQQPKAILFATGLAKPPAQEQVLPLGLVRIGQLVLVVGPAEFTTMAGRRIRAAVAEELGVAPHYVVIAGYANDYAGYVTTREEYESQQYEGGHTLYGPWTEAGYRQEYVRLARALKTGQPVESRSTPEDMRKRRVANSTLDGPDETPPPGQSSRCGHRREGALRSRRLRDGEFLDRQPRERVSPQRSVYGGRTARPGARQLGAGACGFRLGHDLPVAANPRRLRTQAGQRFAVVVFTDRAGPAHPPPRAVPGDSHVADRRGDSGGDLPGRALRPLQEGRKGCSVYRDVAIVSGGFLTEVSEESLQVLSDIGSPWRREILRNEIT